MCAMAGRWMPCPELTAELSLAADEHRPDRHAAFAGRPGACHRAGVPRVPRSSAGSATGGPRGVMWVLVQLMSLPSACTC